MRTAVIIPYFQKETGILRRSVRSALGQTGVAPPFVIVVDDDSPVAAESELAHLLPEQRKGVFVTHQANAGPGAARNTGLNTVPDGHELIAFLDSDDEWTPDHLCNAVEAFRAGCDFYFADHLDYTGETTRFGRFREQGTFRASDHPAIRPGSSIRWFAGDFLDQLIREFVVATPTVVVRRSFLSRERFPVEYRRSGEDHLLWLRLAGSGARVAFSERVECRLGKGVNVYEGSGWGTEGALERSVDHCGVLSRMRSRYAKTAAQRGLLSGRISWTRREFVRILVHDIARGRFPPAGLVGRQIRNDPATLAALAPEFLRIVWERVKSLLPGVRPRNMLP